MSTYALYAIIYTVAKVAVVIYFMVIAWSIASSLKKIANK
jgi:hypothetical protein